MLIWAAATAAERGGCACEEALLMAWLVITVSLLSTVAVFGGAIVLALKGRF